MTGPQRFIPWVLPIGGTVFFILWVMAEVGRLHEAGFYAVVASYALAIALSKALPSVAGALLAAIPVGILVGFLPSYEATTWPVAIASLIVGFVVALFATTFTRWAVLVVGVAQAVLVAYVIVVPTVSSSDRWESWVGIPEDIRNTSQVLIGWMINAAVLYVLAWTAGRGVRLHTRRISGWLPVQSPSQH